MQNTDILSRSAAVQMPDSAAAAERRLLLVDDEHNITRSLSRVLRHEGYEILTANSGEQGLELLQSNHVGVVISDQRMPGMSGTEFLSRVRALYPETIRIVLSGYTDLKTITEAINEGEIYKFISKPWEDDLLKANVVDAFRQYELVNENVRLNKQLTMVNSELQAANDKLEQNVKYQRRNAEINYKSLQVAQEIMQNMPVGILGVDDNSTIVLANSVAHQILSANFSHLLGENIQNILPVSIMQKMHTLAVDGVARLTESDGRHVFIVYQKSSTDIACGTIVVIVPREVSEYEIN